MLDACIGRTYARTFFLCHNRFALDKRNLSAYTPQDFLWCAAQFMLLWTNELGSISRLPLFDCHGHVEDDLSLDKTFIQDLRDLKYSLSKDYATDHRKCALYILSDINHVTALAASCERSLARLGTTELTFSSGMCSPRCLLLQLACPTSACNAAAVALAHVDLQQRASRHF